METSFSPEERAAASTLNADPDAGPGVLDSVKALGSSLRGLAHDHLRIAALETRLAGQSLVNMIAASVALAVLVVSAWLILVAIGVIVLVNNSGVGIVVAMLIALAVNLGVAFMLFRLILELSRHLGFPATLRSLSGARASVPGESLQG